MVSPFFSSFALALVLFISVRNKEMVIIPSGFLILRNVYNVVDDDPAPREEVFAYAWDLVEKKWPGLLKHRKPRENTESSNEKGSSRGEKRVSNVRMKKELGVRLQHPSYKSGLQSIINQMDKPYQCSP